MVPFGAQHVELTQLDTVVDLNRLPVWRLRLALPSVQNFVGAI
jgi:hypothetical protein